MPVYLDFGDGELWRLMKFNENNLCCSLQCSSIDLIMSIGGVPKYYLQMTSRCNENDRD